MNGTEKLSAVDGRQGPEKTCLYELFEGLCLNELEELLLSSGTREEKAFYRSLLNLKLAMAQEKVIGKPLL